MLIKWNKSPLPRPHKIHHVLEDFLTVWTAQQSHILPLRRFLETILMKDLRHHHAHSCLLYTLTHSSPPSLCKNSKNVHALTM